ncbi:hypothetical protein Godav_024325, partial [Gossypium davidsonii]|nr:hypothetical protein [Gossypium davidsonii]
MVYRKKSSMSLIYRRYDKGDVGAVLLVGDKAWTAIDVHDPRHPLNDAINFKGNFHGCLGN